MGCRRGRLVRGKDAASRAGPDVRPLGGQVPKTGATRPPRGHATPPGYCGSLDTGVECAMTTVTGTTNRREVWARTPERVAMPAFLVSPLATAGTD